MTKAGINLRSLRYRPEFAYRLILTGLHYDRRIVETVPNSSFDCVQWRRISASWRASTRSAGFYPTLTSLEAFCAGGLIAYSVGWVACALRGPVNWREQRENSG